jgi:hypothetical protein
MVDAGDRHPTVPDHIRQHAEAAHLRDVEHHDYVGSAELLDRLRGAVDAGQLFEQKPEAGGRRRRIGDADLETASPQQVGQRRLTAEAVTVGIDVGGETDALTRLEHRRESARGGNLFGSQRGHEGIVTGAESGQRDAP